MSRTALLSAVATAAVLAAGFTLNPSHDRHREAIKEAVADRRPIAGLLGLGALTALGTQYHHLGVASYTTLDGRVLSIGALGAVRVLERRSER